MILNERQYGITKTKVREFEEAITQLSNAGEPTDINEQIRRQAQLDTLNSQLEEFQEELAEYEELKKGNTKSLELDFEHLPEALIKARIIRGLTQAQLAEILQVKQQQVQRDEMNKYANASFTKLLGIQKALNLQVKEELIFREESKSTQSSLEKLRDLRRRLGTDVRKTSEQPTD